ncbi:MAG: hypothetical protein A2148_00410 [Chloroflexi bacterium RBG_16_68_14]|nr:MAG: hypothetical protein A2148_00410 [Chloroflexi bacterium RBG_16_68_14]
MQRPPFLSPSQDETARPARVLGIIFYDFRILGKEHLFDFLEEDPSFLSFLNGMGGKRVGLACNGIPEFT